MAGMKKQNSSMPGTSMKKNNSSISPNRKQEATIPTMSMQKYTSSMPENIENKTKSDIIQTSIYASPEKESKKSLKPTIAPALKKIPTL
jgi:hypothetical protein